MEDDRLIPSLWMGSDGPADLDHDKSIRAAMEFERRSGKVFPRFNSIEDADDFAISRSKSGGALKSDLFR